MKILSRHAFRCLLSLTALCGSATSSAQSVPIEKRLPNIAPKWTDQAYKKVRFEGYSFWIDAYDAAVRQANATLCDSNAASHHSLVRLTNIGGATIAWRTGSENGYDWILMANYNVGDVIWADPASAGGLQVGDAIIVGRGIVPPKKRKIKIAPGLALPVRETGDAEYDKIIARQDPIDGGYVRYRNGQFSPIDLGREILPPPQSCPGKGRLSFGGMGVSFSAMVKGATGIGKSLIDEDPNRYYRGSGVPEFRRFTADIFSEDELKWMIVDQFAADLAEHIYGQADKQSFDVAMRGLERATASRLGQPESTEAFGSNWRARAAFLAVYAGLKLGLTEKGYVSFLSARDKAVAGGTTAPRAIIRADVLRAWFSSASLNPRRDSMTASDILESARSMED